MKILFSIIIVSLFILTGCSDGTGYSILKKCSNVQVPYQVTEQYQVDFRYEYGNNYKTTFLDGFDVWAKGAVTVRNVESETGMFTVQQTFTTLNSGSRTITTNHYLTAGESKEFIANYDVDLGEDFNVVYSIIPPKRTLTRTVTKYRTEQRCY